MTCILTISLLTLGDPDQLSGGYLYHRRMAEAAMSHQVRLRFLSVPDLPFVLAVLSGARLLGRARHAEVDVLAVDSIAAAFVGPWLRPAELRRRALTRWSGKGAGQKCDIPLAAVLHQPPGGIDHGRLRRWVQARLDMLAYRRARVLIAASTALAFELEAMGLASTRLWVVPPGRDVGTPVSGLPDDAPPQQGLDLRRGAGCALLCVGNWVRRKGILELLDAVALLPADLVTLHLVGDTEVDLGYSRRVRRRLARPDLVAQVVVHGAVGRDEVGALYRSADVFVLASSKEPYGTVYGEAMAAGLPVVGWRAGNLPHLVTDGIEGLLVRPGDTAGLGAALSSLAKDEGMRRRLGEAALRRAAGFPTWEESAARFFAALREAAENNE